MPEGALLTASLESVLLELAGSAATGCLVVRDQEGEEAEVFLRDGQVYAVSVPGRRVMLGVRLMSRGALTPEALGEALEIQRTELQGWRLGELLVHLGYVEQTVVEEFVVEHLTDALADLLGWPMAAWKFRANKKTRQDVAPPMDVTGLLESVEGRRTTWQQIVATVGGPETVPVLADGPPSDEVALGPNEWALLCKVDGERTISELAEDCGFTLFEAGQVVSRLIDAGLVTDGSLGQTDIAATDAAVETGDDGATHPTEIVEDADELGLELVMPLVSLEEIQRRERAAHEEAERIETERLAREEAERAEAERLAREEAERAEAERRREIAKAAEARRLQQAEILHRELEALAAKEAAARQARLEARKQAEREEAERQRREQAAAERAGAEEQAWADHAQWLADERERAEEQAWAEHAERLAAERVAAEEAAWADHQALLAAERAAAEEAAWSDHVAWLTVERDRAADDAWAEHALRLAAERAAAEEAAWADHQALLAAERAAAEEAAWTDHDAWLAAEEAARLAAEEAERAEQAERERRAAEEAEQARRAAEAEESRRHEAREHAERELQAEAQRRAREAQERAEREAREEAESIAREDAARRTREAAEQAARDEVDRHAEAEAEAIAAEEAARLAAEQRQLEEEVSASAALAAQAASMLTELSRGSMPQEPPHAPEPATESKAVPEPLAASPAADAPEAEASPVEAADDFFAVPTAPPRDLADTAMLLRELSSLGVPGEEEQPGSPSAVPPTRPAGPPTPDNKKKRKGLFGRG